MLFDNISTEMARMSKSPDFHELAVIWDDMKRRTDRGEEIDLTLEQKKHIFVFQNLMTSVYFIDAPGTGVLKIGKSSNVDKRLKTLQTASPVKLNLLMTIEYDDDLERRIHRHREDYRSHGEWFYSCKPVKDFMRAYVDGGIEWLVETVGYAPEHWLNRRSGLSYDMNHP